ncbi:MAG: HD domain-containing protein [Candidatus Omnitrophica bacterium]|nr:HD domain-containing protein [Candidatus Omnitrophota bacterium]MBU1868950.1 HD domain-containing protein [Candidatus Omnitrophota bacterium]
MLERVETTFRDLLAALQIVKLYGTEHPVFKSYLDKAYASIQDILKEKEEFVVGIVGEELVFEKEIFFDLSKLVRPAIVFLKEKGIERLVFRRAMHEEELSKFLVFLSSKKEDIQKEPQEHLVSIGINNIQVSKLKVIATQQLLLTKDFLESRKLYETSLESINDSVTNVLDLGSLDHAVLKFSLRNIMENLILQHQEFLKLTTLKRYDAETFVHLLNVSILSMFFSSKLGFNKDDIMDIGVAALFHDIGKLYISRKIITKAERLNDEEFAKIKSHPMLGSEILLKYVDSLGILPVVVAFEHHLKYNLKGYPKLSFARKPHTASMIVSLCDVYDALSARRSYKADYSPDMIYNIMIKERGESFDPELVDKFFKAMGVWPIGSILSLSDGRIAVVREENEDDIFSPKVEVIFPEDKKESIDLKENKEQVKIARYLNPWKEGKDYLHLIKPES